MTYQTPAGSATFQHVGLLAGARLGYSIDADRKGFVIAAAVPRSAIPELPLFKGEFTTRVNFDANFGGHNRFWWANADGSASRETYDEPSEAQLYPGSWSQAQFEPVQDLAVRTWRVIGPFGFARLPGLRVLEDRKEIIRIFAETSFPPEKEIDLAARYRGEFTQTRTEERALSWRSVDIIGDRVAFGSALANGWKEGGPDEGVAYLLTYIYSPRVANVMLHVMEDHGAHAVRAWLEDRRLPEKLFQGDADLPRIDAETPVELHAGWNKLLMRYDWIWGELALGIRLHAAPETLWRLNIRANPP
jgi:hypothetical protein